VIDSTSSVLIYGYGNPSRGDDSLGILFADTIAERMYPCVTTYTNYQLNAEDALAMSENDIVLFADASENNIVSFLLRPCKAEAEISFSTHAMSPGSIVSLCTKLYGKVVPTFLLEIKGYTWELGDSLSEQAEKNLTAALAFIDPLLPSPSADAFFLNCQGD